MENLKPVDRDKLEFKALLAALYRERIFVLAPAVLAVAALTIYFMNAPRYYSATAQILIDVQKPKILAGEAVVPSLDTTRYLIDPVIESQVQIMLSNRIAQRVIKKVRLDEDPEYQPQSSWLGSIRSLFGLLSTKTDSGAEEEADSERAPPSLVAKFLSRLDVRRKGQTLILFIQFTDKRPARAAEIANAVMDAYLEDQQFLQVQAARRANDLLTARVAELRGQVLSAELKLQEYREANNLISVEGSSVGAQQISATINQLTAARTTASNKLAELRQVQQFSEKPIEFESISKVLNSGVIRDLRLQTTTVMRNIANATSKFGENDTRVDVLRSELENIEKEIKQEIQRLTSNARYDYEVAETQVEILEKNLAELMRKSAKSNRLSIRLAELEREASSTRDLYLNLLSRLKETTVQESLLYPDARIVEMAVKPRIPSSPKKLMTLAITLIGSLGFGITWVFLKDHLSTVLRSAREVEELIPSVQTIPVLLTSERAPQINSIAVSNPNSSFAQSIFSINRAIWTSPLVSDSRRIVAVASPLDGEGKTTIAANLANYSALLNTKTLLIDCDFRAPGLSSQLPGKTNEWTLADVLQGSVPAKKAIEQIGDTCLFVCRAPAVGTVSHPMEMLSSVQMQRLLNTLKREYPLIILDTSALLPTVDARALMGFVECTILVVEAERTTSENVNQAFRVAGDLRHNTAVVVFNKTASEFS